jgi:hypothetical protein
MRLLAKQVPSLSSHIPFVNTAVRSTMPPWCCPRPGWFWRPPCAGWHAAYLRIKWCGQPVTLRRLNDGVVASWLLDHGRLKTKGAPGLDHSNATDAPQNLSCGPDRPSGRRFLSAGLHNKERTPLRALVSRTRRYFTADVSVFQAHLPCDLLPIFLYRTKI